MDYPVAQTGSAGSSSDWTSWASTISGALLGAVAANREGVASGGGGVGAAGYLQAPNATAQQYQQEQVQPNYTKWLLIGGGILVGVVLLKKLL